MPQLAAHLNLAFLQAAWSTLTWPDNFDIPHLHYVETIDSTNAWAWIQAPNQSQSPHVFVASQQTAGRGQWGRTWVSPTGGLYLSLWLPTAPIPPLLLTLVSAWGIAESLRRQQIPVVLKWPNDLMVQEHKLGGIKVETRPKTGQGAVVIGIGINGANPVPPGAIAIQDCPEQTVKTLAQLAAEVSSGVLGAIAQYPALKSSGFLARYWELLETKQRSVTVAGGQGQIIGLTPRGQLRVRLAAPGASAELVCEPSDVTIGYPALRS